MLAFTAFSSAVVLPQNVVFLAHNAIFSHDLGPVFNTIVDINMPKRATARILLIFYRDRKESFDVVVKVLLGNI